MTSHDHIWVVRYHLVGGYWSRAREDIKYLICQVMSQNYMIERLCNTMTWNY